MISAVLFLFLYVAASAELYGIPQQGFATLAAMFATLLGLTFAAFSVLTALMPSVPKNLIRTKMFLMFGQTFVATMWLQMVTLLAAGLCYLDYGNKWISDLGVVVIFLAIASTAFLLVVVHYMLYLFKLVRREIGGEGLPQTVL